LADGGDHRDLGSVGAAELPQDVQDVRIDSSLGNGQSAGDLLVRQAASDQVSHLLLPPGEAGPGGRARLGDAVWTAALGLPSRTMQSPRTIRV